MNRKSLLDVTWLTLFTGCVRESLAAVYSVARIGLQETRAWEMPIRYVVDDNQGNVGVVEFGGGGAVGAVSARNVDRSFTPEDAILYAPLTQQEHLRRVCELPLLDEGVSFMFWTAGLVIEAPKPWNLAYDTGMDLFRRELLSDGDWRVTSAEYYALSSETAWRLIDIAHRARVQAPMLELTESELRMLVPNDSEYATMALELLFEDGIFSALPQRLVD